MNNSSSKETHSYGGSLIQMRDPSFIWHSFIGDRFTRGIPHLYDTHSPEVLSSIFPVVHGVSLHRTSELEFWRETWDVKRHHEELGICYVRTRVLHPRKLGICSCPVFKLDLSLIMYFGRKDKFIYIYVDIAQVYIYVCHVTHSCMRVTWHTYLSCHTPTYTSR